MAIVPNSSLKTWNDGDTIHASDYTQDRSILQTAINDNGGRVVNLSSNGSDYTGTWKGFSVDQVKNLATSIKTKTWIATANQTVFALGTSDDPYIVGNNSTELLIGGVPQNVGEGYTETNSTTITTSEGIPNGVEVTLRYQLTMAVTDTPISQLIGYAAMATQTWVEGSYATIAQPSWTPVTLQNGWTNTANGAYRKTSFGYVELRGQITAGTITDGTLLFTLPSGYTPNVSKQLLAYSGDSSTCARIIINTDGSVLIYDLTVATAVSMDGLFIPLT